LTPPDAGEVLNVEDWAEIRRLHRAEGVPIKEIARRLGVARNTVRAALASDRPPKYERVRRGSVADAYEPRVRALLAQWPRMPGPVIAQRIDWPYSEGPLKKLLARIRPEYVGIDPVDRVVYEPWQIAQCDLAVRAVVPRDTGLGRRGAGADPAGAGGDVGVLSVPLGDDDPVAPGRGHRRPRGRRRRPPRTTRRALARTVRRARRLPPSGVRPTRRAHRTRGLCRPGADPGPHRTFGLGQHLVGGRSVHEQHVDEVGRGHPACGGDAL